jgi:hypothetical protein
LFLQERSQNTPPYGDVLCNKAKFLYLKITNKPKLKARGLFGKFKQRYGIHHLTIIGEKLFHDTLAVETFQ